MQINKKAARRGSTKACHKNNPSHNYLPEIETLKLVLKNRNDLFLEKAYGQTISSRQRSTDGRQ